MSNKRKYVKKSQYWNKKIEVEQPKQKQLVSSYSFDDQKHYTAMAACGNGNTSETKNYRNLDNETLIRTNRYQNIRSGLIPVYRDGGRYSVSETLELVYRAYFNVAIIRNAINSMVDFSVSKVFVESENLNVKKFFEAWLKAINIEDFMAKYFLEYYRSGNNFIYTFNGQIAKDKFEKLKTSFGAKNDKIPIRYVILNPMQVSFQSGVGYVKALSTYEIARLKNPQTEEDVQVFKSLPQNIRDQIKSSQGTVFNEILIPLDPERLHYAFYRKQDYEPMAVPMVFPVLNDIEDKLELKKMDMALARTIEQIVLLVTTGEPADQYNGGLNPENIAAIKEIFNNQTIGRVFVADYTTKMEWKIPDMKQLLGDEKYRRVDADIKEGLQYVFFGDEKFANASIKAKIFVESLKEGRRMFLDNFLMVEANKICKKMNFKNLPKFIMEPISVDNVDIANKLYVQMAQLGLLTPDELNKAIETGILPEKSDSIKNQKEYAKQRKDEHIYVPLLGGSDQGAQDSANGRPAGSKAPQTTKRVSPIGTSKGSYDSEKVIENTFKLNKVMDSIYTEAKIKWKIKDDFTDSQRSVLHTLAQSIVFNESEDKWNESNTIKAYFSKPKSIPAHIDNEITAIASDNDLKSWAAGILFLSKTKE